MQSFAGCATAEGAAALEGQRNVRAKVMDVTDDAAIKTIVQEVTLSGLTLRALVNNAAVSSYGFAECLPMRRFEECMDVNYFGAVRVTRHFASNLEAC